MRNAHVLQKTVATYLAAALDRASRILSR